MARLMLARALLAQRRLGAGGSGARSPAEAVSQRRPDPRPGRRAAPAQQGDRRGAARVRAGAGARPGVGDGARRRSRRSTCGRARARRRRARLGAAGRSGRRTRPCCCWSRLALAMSRRCRRGGQLQGRHRRRAERPRGLRVLARLYLAQGRLDDAVREFDALASKQPRDVAARTMAAILSQMQGAARRRRPRATSRSLKLDPRAAVAANNLAWRYAETGKDLGRPRLAQAANALMPRAARGDATRWPDSTFARRQPALALAPLREAVEHAPDNPVYRARLGTRLADAGQNDGRPARAGAGAQGRRQVPRRRRGQGPPGPAPQLTPPEATEVTGVLLKVSRISNNCPSGARVSRRRNARPGPCLPAAARGGPSAGASERLLLIWQPNRDGEPAPGVFWTTMMPIAPPVPPPPHRTPSPFLAGTPAACGAARSLRRAAADVRHRRLRRPARRTPSRPTLDSLSGMAGALRHRGPDEFGTLPRRPRRPRARPAVDHRPVDRPAAAGQRGPTRCGSSSTARSSTTSSCAPSSRRSATASAPAATPRSSSTPTRQWGDGGVRPLQRPVGDRAVGHGRRARWCWRAIRSACGRSTLRARRPARTSPAR